MLECIQLGIEYLRCGALEVLRICYSLCFRERSHRSARGLAEIDGVACEDTEHGKAVRQEREMDMLACEIRLISVYC